MSKIFDFLIDNLKEPITSNKKNTLRVSLFALKNAQ